MHRDSGTPRMKGSLMVVRNSEPEETMNKRFLSVTIFLFLLFGSAACQSFTRTRGGNENAQSPTTESSSQREAVKWPPLSRAVLSPYVLNTTQLAQVGAGDTLALPLANGFQTL